MWEREIFRLAEVSSDIVYHREGGWRGAGGGSRKVSQGSFEFMLCITLDFARRGEGEGWGHMSFSLLWQPFK